jgi:nucleoside-diphosphate kinase
MERTFVMLKPDAVERGLVGEIIRRLEATGLRLAALRMLRPTRSLAEQQYGEEIARKYGDQVREWLLEYICSGPVVAMIWEGRNAVSVVRAIAGEKPSPSECAPGTIRRDLCTDSQELAAQEARAIENLVHTADSPEAARRETALWFGDGVL